MRKCIILTVVFLSAMTMSAQLRMNTSGQIELGKELKNDAVLSKVSADTLSAVKIMGPHGMYGGGDIIVDHGEIIAGDNVTDTKPKGSVTFDGGNIELKASSITLESGVEITGNTNFKLSPK